MITLSFIGMGLEIIYCIAFLNCFNGESSEVRSGAIYSNPFQHKSPYG